MELVKCHCCALAEECTRDYIVLVRERYQGRWICGLCAEAVKDESFRSQKDMSTDEALKRHLTFCERFRSSSPPSNSTDDLIVAMKRLLRRGLDSPERGGLGCGPILRSKSCFPRIPQTEPSGKQRRDQGCGVERVHTSTTEH